MQAKFDESNFDDDKTLLIGSTVNFVCVLCCVWKENVTAGDQSLYRYIHLCEWIPRLAVT